MNEYLLLIIIFVLGYIVGMGLGFFLKKIFKVFLFFLGYAAVVVILLWLIGVFPANEFVQLLWQKISSIHFTTATSTIGIIERIRSLLTEKTIISIIGGVFGFIHGLKSG